MIVGVTTLSIGTCVSTITTVVIVVVLLVARTCDTGELSDFSLVVWVRPRTLRVVSAVLVNVDVGVAMDRQLQADDKSAPLVYAEKHDGLAILELLELLLAADVARLSKVTVTTGLSAHPVGYAVA